MSAHLGKDENNINKYQKLIRETLYLQALAAGGPLKSIPLVGTFLQYRGSMLNWCFIGRDADHLDRKEFISIDETQNIRQFYKKHLDQFTENEGIDVTSALGGETSIDIYPRGWDKTYALSYYPEHVVYFVGDACQPGGNDWHLYHALESQGRAWMTDGPKDTVNIINRLIEKL